MARTALYLSFFMEFKVLKNKKHNHFNHESQILITTKRLDTEKGQKADVPSVIYVNDNGYIMDRTRVSS